MFEWWFGGWSGGEGAEGGGGGEGAAAWGEEGQLGGYGELEERCLPCREATFRIIMAVGLMVLDIMGARPQN